MSECVSGECAKVAMATMAEAHLEWRRIEELRMVQEATKVVAIEIEMESVSSEVRELGAAILRCGTSFSLSLSLSLPPSLSPSLPPLLFHYCLLEHLSPSIQYREGHIEFSAMVMSVCEDVLCEGVGREVWEVGEGVVREAEEERWRRLGELEKQVLTRRLKRFWKW